MQLRNFEVELKSVDEAQNLGDLHKALGVVKTKLRFDHFAFIQANVSRTNGILLQDYPESWVRMLSDTYGYTRSPVLLAAANMPAPFEWEELPELINMSEEQQQYMSTARDHGLEFGYSIPLHSPGEPSAVMSFVNGKARQLNRDSLPLAIYTATRAFAAGRRIKRATNAAGSSLSNHDRRIITQLCRGLSRVETARKIGTDMRSVNEVINRACKHYAVGSQTEVVVRALFEQTIRFEDVIR